MPMRIGLSFQIHLISLFFLVLLLNILSFISLQLQLLFANIVKLFCFANKFGCFLIKKGRKYKMKEMFRIILYLLRGMNC